MMVSQEELDRNITIIEKHMASFASSDPKREALKLAVDCMYMVRNENEHYRAISELLHYPEAER